MELLRVIDINQVTSHETFADLVDLYGEPVYKFCRSITYSKEDADDLFQETFLKAFEQRKKINDWDNPQSFLFSVALYIWKSWKRKYARRRRLAPVESLDETVASHINMENDLVAQEEIRIVRQLVNELPDKFKIPTILYYTMELSLSDIATTLKLPVGTVKSRLFKARKIIEKGLVETYYEK